MALDMCQREICQQPLSERSARVERLVMQGLFWFSGPLWVVADENRVTTDPSGTPTLTEGDGRDQPPPGRTETVMLFTDRELTGLMLRPGRVAACIPSTKRLASYLRRAQSRGETHLALDSGARSLIVPIGQALESIGRDAS